MKKYLFLSFIVILLATAISYAADVSGKWAGTIALFYDVTVNMKQDNGKLNGVATTEIGDVPLKDGVITGNDVVFKPFTYNGFAVSYIKGKIDGDKMDIIIGFQGTTFTGTLKRVK